MAIAAWKRFEKTPQWQRKKRFLKRLIGKELRVGKDLELPVVKEGGWWFAPQLLEPDSVVYSLGVGDEVDFDLYLIRSLGVEIHAFDPTPASTAMLDSSAMPPGFHFHPWAVSASDGTLKFYPRLRRDGTKSDVMFTLVATGETAGDAIEVPSYTLQTISARLGHDRIDLLKMDIEGAEYDVLDGLLDSPIQPRQLLVEFHHRFVPDGLAKTYRLIERLRDAGYGIFAISEIGREISFVRDC